jgi:DNA polymerase-3 subunit gamma/tau
VIASILEQASPLAIELPLLHIGLPKGSFALGQLEDRDYLDALTGLAGEYFGGEVRVKVSVVAAGSGQVPPSLAAERKERESDRERRLREDALAHPMVQAATDIFGARLVEIKPTDKGFV